MRYIVEQSYNNRHEWITQAIDADGRIYRAIFDCADAEDMAREYADWKNQQADVRVA